MLLLIHWKSFEFSTWLTREMFIWLKNSTLGISNSEDSHYLHWRLAVDYPGHVTTYFRTQCQRPVHPKDLICDIWHSIKIKYPYTKPQSPTPFNSNSHPSHFCTKLWSKTILLSRRDRPLLVSPWLGITFQSFTMLSVWLRMTNDGSTPIAHIVNSIRF